ncbi:MAG: amino-acid N-acetyltransferase [Gammaproteobacteria bacterium]|nr:amino-acid N-acetyltransferase [Gammaproteobacteria bacterium]
METFDIETFRSAAPYIYAHQGNVFVITIPSSVIENDQFSALIQDLALMQTLGIKLVLVYGTGLLPRNRSKKPIIDTKKLLKVQHKIGELQSRIESLFSTGLINTPMAGMKLTTVSGNFVHAKPTGVVNGIDLQFHGEVRRIDTQAIQHQLEHNNIVLLSSLGYSPSGECFYLDEYDVATTVAASIPSEKLIFLINEKTLQNSRKQRIKFLTLNSAQDLLARRKTLSKTLRQHIELAINACLNRVQRVHLLSTDVPGALLQELYSHDGAGTLITAEHYNDIRQASIEDVGGIISLINPLEEQQILVHRTREQIELEIHNYDVIERDGFVIACGALHPLKQKNIGEIACIAVHPDFQKEGHGNRILKHLEQKAWSLNLNSVFVLTTKALHWFRENGYRKSTTQELPINKQKTYNYQRNSRVYIKSNK